MSWDVPAAVVEIASDEVLTVRQALSWALRAAPVFDDDQRAKLAAVENRIDAANHEAWSRARWVPEPCRWCGEPVEEGQGWCQSTVCDGDRVVGRLIWHDTCGEAEQAAETGQSV